MSVCMCARVRVPHVCCGAQTRREHDSSQGRCVPGAVRAQRGDCPRCGGAERPSELGEGRAAQRRAGSAVLALSEDQIQKGRRQGVWRAHGCKGGSLQIQPQAGSPRHSAMVGLSSTLPATHSLCSHSHMFPSECLPQGRGGEEPTGARAGRCQKQQGLGEGAEEARLSRCRLSGPPQPPREPGCWVTSGARRVPWQRALGIRVERALGEARVVWDISAFPPEASRVLSVPARPSGAPSPLTCFPKSVAGLAQCHLHCLTGHPARPSAYRLSGSWRARGTPCDLQRGPGALTSPALTTTTVMAPAMTGAFARDQALRGPLLPPP